MNKPKKPPLKWHGSKWRIAPWIISHFPSQEHHDVYVEPYAGGGSVLLRKDRSRLEVWNDLDDQVYNFFDMLRRWPDHLIILIKNTPYHKVEFDKAWADLPEGHNLTLIELARMFYVRSHMSIMGATALSNSGFRRQKVYSRGRSGRSSMKPASHTFAEVNYLHDVVERLKGVTFEHMPALELIKLYDTPRTLFYIDPPYLGSTRRNKTANMYTHEMLDEESHARSLSQFSNLVGIPLISGYNSELYRDMLELKGWKLVEKEARTNGANSATECLWLSPNLLKLLSK